MQKIYFDNTMFFRENGKAHNKVEAFGYSHHDQNHTSSGKKICLGVIDGSVVFENQSIGVAALIFYTLMRMYRH